MFGRRMSLVEGKVVKLPVVLDILYMGLAFCMDFRCGELASLRLYLGLALFLDKMEELPALLLFVYGLTQLVLVAVASGTHIKEEVGDIPHR